MTFIVVLVALLIERFFDWSHLRQWGWYGACERMVMDKIPGASPYLVLLGSIVPLLVGLAILKFFFSGLMYGFPWLVFQLFVLLYCFGPQNLWADAFSSIAAVTGSDAGLATDKLKSAFQIGSTNSPEALHRELLNHIFIASNQRIFAVIFWYGVLGLPGALLYRLMAVSAENTAGPEINNAARVMVMVMDWVPARILSFIFALAGNFTRVLNVWRKRAMLGLDGNDLLLTECGLAAITDDSEKITQDGSLEKSAVSLLDRVFIILLVVVIALVFVF